MAFLQAPTLSVVLLLSVSTSLILIHIVPAHAEQSNISISRIMSVSSFDPTLVKLICDVDSGNSQNATYYRRVSDHVEVFFVGNSVISFELTPAREGIYFCSIDNVNSSNTVELVAYPLLNGDTTDIRTYRVEVGGSVTVDCAYVRGMLGHKYSVKWYKGLHQLPIIPGTIDVLYNFSLVLSDVQPKNASSAYFCEVTVDIDDQNVTKRSPMVQVDVIAPIEITQYLQEQVVLPNSGDTSFTCTITAMPEPEIKWTFNGQELVNSDAVKIRQQPTVLMRRTSIVQSTVTLSRWTKSGQVVCVGHHMQAMKVKVVATQANLVVLTNDFNSTLENAATGVRLHATLPYIIPGQFELVALYQNDRVRSSRNIIHPSLRNTKEIDIIIPTQSLPPFKTFSVILALRVGDLVGASARESNPITVSDSIRINESFTNQECICKTDEGESSSSSGVAFAALLAVLVIVILFIIVGISVLLLVLFHLRKTYHKKFASTSVITRSRTRTRSRSASCSSHGSQKSYVSNRSTSTHEAYDNKGAEYDPFDHKKLEQWEEDQKRIAAVAAETGEGIMMQDIGYHRRHGREAPFVTNPALIRCEKKTLKPSESTSSFEDLEDESEEFKHDAPKTA